MSRRRLLLIEENWALRLMIEHHLRASGICEVEATNVGHGAFERAELGQYDLAVVSLELRQYPSARLIKELGGLRPAPLILTTGSPKSLEALEPQLASGLWEAMPLPLSRTLLTHVLTRALEQISQRDCASLVTSSPLSEPNEGGVPRRRRKSGPVGYRLGRYELLDRLGCTTKGAVYRSLIPSTGRTVAVRVFPRELLERLGRGRWWREWFQREVNVATSVSDPHVSSVIDHGATDDDRCLYLVSELIEGETLAARLRRGPLTPAGATRVALHIARALEAVHSVGFAHRLVRPTNIVLDPDGNATLTDVGVAGILAWDLVPLRGRLDALPYTSPEQIRFSHVDDRGDQFSLGLVLHEALTGRSPFGGESPSGRVRAILRNDPDLSLGEVTQGREKLREILGVMLARDSEARYQGDIELQAALKECLRSLEEASAQT